MHVTVKAQKLYSFNAVSVKTIMQVIARSDLFATALGIA